jgi:hypothetical protein
MNATPRETNAVREKRRRPGVGGAWVVDGLAECRMKFLHDKPQPRRPSGRLLLARAPQSDPGQVDQLL